MADTTCSEVGRALWEISNATGWTHYAAIHPCGSIALVRGDLRNVPVCKWTTAEQAIGAVEKLKEKP